MSNTIARSVFLALLPLMIAGCDLFAPLEPPTPPLLANVRAVSGWWGACPPQNKTQVETMQTLKGKLAVSPELNERLTKEFPAGTDESQLIGVLTQQGFDMQPSCSNDHSIHRAYFAQHGGGLAYRIQAEVFWKVDDHSAIMWTKGFVSYDGL